MPTHIPGGLVMMIDGPDGVGKTTQIELAQAVLQKAGYEVSVKRVNGGTPIGEALRQVMLSDLERPPSTDLHIHLAQQHALNAEIQRNRQAGLVTLVDRSPLSIVAYQVFGSSLDKDEGYAAADEIMHLFQPELLIAYAANGVVLESRRALARRGGDYFDNKPLDYLDRVIVGYGEAAKYYRAQVIDASGSIEEVHRVTMEQINAVLRRAARATGAPAPSLSDSEH